MLLAPVYNLGTCILASGKLRPSIKTFPEIDLLACLGKTLAVEYSKILLTAKSTRLESIPKIPLLEEISASMVRDSKGTQIGCSHNPAHSAIVMRLMREETIEIVELDIEKRSLMFCFGADSGYDGRCSLPDLVNFLHGQGKPDSLSEKKLLAITKTAMDTTTIPWVEHGSLVYNDQGCAGDTCSSRCNPEGSLKRKSSCMQGSLS